MSHEQISELIPLYAIDALELDEAHDVSVHVDACSSCRDELFSYQSVTSALIPDASPPFRVWARIVASIDAQPDGGFQSEPSDETVVTLDSRRPRYARWVTLSAVAAAVAVVLGIVAVAQRGLIADLQDEGGVIAAAERASLAQGSISVDFLSEDAVVAQLVLSSEGEGFILPTEHLQELEETLTYQLWVITDQEKVISAGVLGNDPKASTFTWDGGVSGFALTTEVAGGVVISEGDVVSAITDI